MNRLLLIILFVFIVLLLLSSFFLTIRIVRNSSMENTLFDGDVVLCFKYNRWCKPKVNDICYFEGYSGVKMVKRIIATNQNAVIFNNGNYYIDSIMLKKHKTAISEYQFYFKSNVSRIEIIDSILSSFDCKRADVTFEKYISPFVLKLDETMLNQISEKYYLSIDSIVFYQHDLNIPNISKCNNNEKGYFMAGDNYSGSMDSRSFGCVSESLISGKVVMILYRKNNYRIKNNGILIK